MVNIKGSYNNGMKSHLKFCDNKVQRVMMSFNPLCLIMFERRQVVESGCSVQFQFIRRSPGRVKLSH